MARDVEGSSGPFVYEGDVSIRRLRHLPHDYRLLARWLTDERVLEYYQGRDQPLPYERVVEKYAPRVREGPIVPCLLCYSGREVGYLQYYLVGEPADYEIEDAADIYGVDMFIGEPYLWQQGIGSIALAALVQYLFDQLRARKVVIDPHVDNPRAVRAYEKAGFRKIKVLKDHEWHEGAKCDCWLMAIERWPGQDDPLT